MPLIQLYLTFGKAASKKSINMVLKIKTGGKEKSNTVGVQKFQLKCRRKGITRCEVIQFNLLQKSWS